MKDLIKLNDRKTKCSLHIDPMLNKNEATGFHIAGIGLRQVFLLVLGTCRAQPIKIEAEWFWQIIGRALSISMKTHLSNDLKTVWIAPRVNTNPINFKDPLNNIQETIQNSLTGLMRFFCAGNIAPVSIVMNPRLFQDDFISFVESVFTTLIVRFYCIR